MNKHQENIYKVEIADLKFRLHKLDGAKRSLEWDKRVLQQENKKLKEEIDKLKRGTQTFFYCCNC